MAEEPRKFTVEEVLKDVQSGMDELLKVTGCEKLDNPGPGTNDDGTNVFQNVYTIIEELMNLYCGKQNLVPVQDTHAHE